MDPVIVTASRMDTIGVVRSREAHVMPRSRIDLAPASSLAGWIHYTGGCDVASRGCDGIQSDFSIRGSSFEQVLILLDGVKMNNPQTGHHNADIPVAAADVDRIEILTGHGSSLYGSGGFGGVIHVLTDASAKNRLRVDWKGGSHRTASGSLSQAFRFGPLSGTLAVEKAKSNGYRFDTDYDVTVFSFRSSLASGNSRIGLSFGQREKDFGANGFYADYPSREKTLARQARLGIEIRPRSGPTLQAQAYLNRNKDFFLLDLNRPDGYRNRHTTTVSGGSIQANGHFAINGDFALGIEGDDERMNSSRLGNRRLFKASVWNQTAYPLSGTCSVDAEWRLDFGENRQTQFNPSVGIAVAFLPTFRWRTSAGRAFRYPNFTELYYDDPANHGNPNLKPEAAWCGETGWVLTRKSLRAEWTVFLRDERDRIDWIRQAEYEPWQATNLPRNTVAGMSLFCQRLFGETLTLIGSFTALRSSARPDQESKYLSNTLERQSNFSAAIRWYGTVKQGVFITIKKRRESAAAAWLDSKISYGWKGLTVYLTVTNLTNTRYEEFPGIPMPGTRFMMGGTITIG